MSTERCEHGRVVYDTVGEYRCWLCEPFTETEYEEIQGRLVDAEQKIEALEARLSALEPSDPSEGALV